MFNECCDTFLDGLRPLADGKREVDIMKAIHEVAFNIISKIMWRPLFWNGRTKVSIFFKAMSRKYCTL